MFDTAVPRRPAAPAEIAQRLEVAPHLFFRWLSTIIDYISLTLAFILLVGATAKIPGLSNAAAVTGLVGVLAYFPVTEGIWGRSLGKLITGLIVVDRHGRPPGIGKATLRTLLRLVEVNPFLVGGIPAAICVGVSQYHQRLGDLAADTFVIPKRDLPRAPVDDIFG